ncbi:thiamine pyrophosphate-binding protein [Mycobacterium sp. 236(2023)]|uniref:thiamine pyrophosphate-binding protein n=1 Tax=Mycobacterium sp. 236(2023) TaxID=3038163 RepID=UPI00241557FA|nr:thiamine pyrophosphate-binding protein [Mycobacterium sp. 236(2023)]MDG4663977.1 thiamine pyrophosphate-binding protein [Mycobacterium sp. 236(2023)]
MEVRSGEGIRVVDHIVDHLAAHGVRHIFGVDGANIEDLYDAAYFRDDITAVLTKHEFSAAAMADGYRRSGGPIAVVAATSGGGCLNTLAGLGESLASRVPVLALIGQAPTPLDGHGSFQDTSGDNGALDAVALFSAVSRYCRRIRTAQEILTALPEALAEAERGGPAVLLLPKNIQQTAIEDAHWTDGKRRRPVCSDVTAVAEALLSTTGPVTIIAGEQVGADDARLELMRLGTALRARVVTVPDAKDVAESPIGVSGVMGHPSVVTAVAQSAVCLLLGTRMSVTARAGLDGVLTTVPTLSIGSAPPYLPCAHVHSENLRASLSALFEAVRRSRRAVPAPLPRRELQPPPAEGPGVRYRAAMRIMDEAIPDGCDIVVDAGNIGASAIHYLPARRDGRFLVALGMGGMGYSFGAGIGVSFHRGRRTVVIAGDGAFFMHGMEIHTALQYRLPITFCLFDNHAHAMCVTREQQFYGDRYSYNRFGPSRLGAGLAAMFPGLTALDVSDVDQLPAALRVALDHDGPAVVAVDCSPDEIPPFAAFLTTKEDSHVAART